MSGGRFLESGFPLLVWASLTALFSSDAFAASETSRFIEPLLRLLFPAAPDETIAALHGVIRKLAHVFEYLVMGVLAARAVLPDPVLTRGLVLAGIFVASTAVLDELGQMLTAYRGASPIDVGYDWLGGTLGIWIGSVLAARPGIRRPVGASA